jgi:hypothetical protein
MSPADQVMFRRKRRPRRRRSPSCGPTSFRWFPSALAEVPPSEYCADAIRRLETEEGSGSLLCGSTGGAPPACGTWVCDGSQTISSDGEPRVFLGGGSCGHLTDDGRHRTATVADVLDQCLASSWAAGQPLVGVGGGVGFYLCTAEDGLPLRACVWPEAVARAECGGKAIGYLLRPGSVLSDGPASVWRGGELCVETSDECFSRDREGCTD